MTGPDGVPPLRHIAPPLRRSRWPAAGLPLFVVLPLAGAAAVTMLRTTAGPDVRPAQDAASAYAQALVDERFAEAQQMFCARDKAAISPASLAEHYFRPDLTDYRVEGVDLADSQGTAVARAAVRFTTNEGRHHATDLPLVKENGTWRPCP